MVLKAPYFTKNNKEGERDKGIGVPSKNIHYSSTVNGTRMNNTYIQTYIK